MANTVARQVLINGSRNYVIKFTVVGDGSGEASAVLINATSGDCGTDNKIMSIKGICTGCTGQILFDATTDLFAIGLPQDKDIHLDFKKVGGLINDAGTGKTGDLLFTSSGLGSGDTVTLVITIKKK